MTRELHKIEKKIVENIRILRILRRLTQTSLSKMINRDAGFLSRIENHKSRLCLGDYIKLSHMLNVSFDELNQ